MSRTCLCCTTMDYLRGQERRSDENMRSTAAPACRCIFLLSGGEIAADTTDIDVRRYRHRWAGDLVLGSLACPGAESSPYNLPMRPCCISPVKPRPLSGPPTICLFLVRRVSYILTFGCFGFCCSVLVPAPLPWRHDVAPRVALIPPRRDRYSLAHHQPWSNRRWRST